MNDTQTTTQNTVTTDLPPVADLPIQESVEEALEEISAEAEGLGDVADDGLDCD